MKKILFIFLITVSGSLYAQEPHTLTREDVDFEEGVIIDYHGTAGPSIVIPSELGGEPVMEIGERAFAESELTSVTIPDSVISIGEYAFAWNEMTSVVIPDSVTATTR